MLPLQNRVELGVMATKGFSTFPKAPVLLEPHHQIVLCHIQYTRWESLTPLQRSSRCILQPQPMGLRNIEEPADEVFALMNKYISSLPSSSSSSSCAVSTDFPKSISRHPSLLLSVGPLNNILCPYRIEVSSCWSASTFASMCRGPLKNITYEFVFALQKCLACLIRLT